LKRSNGKHLYLGIWQHFTYFLQHFSSEKCEVSSLGFGFYGKVSVSKFQPSLGLGLGGYGLGGCGLGGYGLDYINAIYLLHFGIWRIVTRYGQKYIISKEGIRVS